MSRPKLTNAAEELKKLFRDYPEMVPAYQWVERNQDRLTAPIHVEEYRREDKDGGATLVPIFVVDNSDDYHMLYSNLREDRGFYINLLLRRDEWQNDDLDCGGDLNLKGPGDTVTVHRCSYSKCKEPIGTMALQSCHTCSAKYIHHRCFLDHIAPADYLQKYSFDLDPEHVFCSKKCLRRHDSKHKRAAKDRSGKQKQSRLWNADDDLKILAEWLTTEGNYAAYAGNPKFNKEHKPKSEYQKDIDAFIASRTGVSRGVKSVENKIRHLLESYKNAREILHQSGYGSYKPGKIPESIKKRCPYFDELDRIMGDRPHVRPEVTTDDALESLPNDDSLTEDDGDTVASASKTMSTDQDMCRSKGSCSESENEMNVKPCKKAVAGMQKSSSSAPERGTASKNDHDIMLTDDNSSSESVNDVQVTTMIEGHQNSNDSGKHSKAKARKRSTASRKRSITQEHLALPSARNSEGRRATRDPVVKHLLGDPLFKRKALQELDSLTDKAKAEELLIRTQTKDAAAKAKEAEIKLKAAEEKRRYELLLNRQELISKGISMEQLDIILPLPNIEQSSD